MASEVSICNRALQILGEEPILALTANTKAARNMQLAYEPVRNAELRNRRWKFAIKRASLAALASAPAFGFDVQYQLPNDFLRLIQIGEFDLGPDLSSLRVSPTGLFEIEGRALLTNITAPLPIRYIFAATDASTFDPSFCEALSAKLAEATCEALTQSDSKIDRCVRTYDRAIRAAMRASALESAPQEISDGTWVAARAQ